jgi:hypothetical protein
MVEMHEWLDPTTRAILCRNATNRKASVQAGAYSLLLLEKGIDDARIQETIAAIQQGASPTSELPFVLVQHMSFVDALAGQFALACCDCAAAILPDEVLDRADRAFFRELYVQVINSDDYQRIQVEVSDVPPTDEGRRFCWQFLGLATGLALPSRQKVFRIKAELMAHWAKRSGISIRIEAVRRGRCTDESQPQPAG